ncbi:gamma-glutamylcyclotransferase [Carboxylicivirga mesophila]|uniref:Gamma-glutamylcyclotransferase n=1 Tax=Carboxylicivirga mesophila TaxID=1166478 RepID=A0ABS5KFX8_9BACT|nr:gamma-glutamylcyclotransferase family protein [Carboxylicivirga mesophila]MBS2213707.1 gamma-glutamylcyclotransferase [Carboxylicivirga mesophila]
MSPNNGHYLFVYGTLLNNSDHPMATYLNQQAKFTTSGFLVGKLYKVDDYPGAIVTQQIDERVYGQIYSLQNEEQVLNELDKYEETGVDFSEPCEYIREVVEVFDDFGKVFNCWVYLYNWPVDDLVHIPSGNYQAYLTQTL